MPNKTIYVSADDLPLFQRAQELSGGNLSSAIVTALRHYVAVQEDRLAGYDEVILQVGTGSGRKVRFSGVLLGEWGNATAARAEIYRVYRSRTQKFVLHVERTGEHIAADGPAEGWRGLIGMGRNQSLVSFLSGEQTWGFTQGESTLEVFGSLAELKAKVPEKLYKLIERAADAPPVEDLDI